MNLGFGNGIPSLKWWDELGSLKKLWEVLGKLGSSRKTRKLQVKKLENTIHSLLLWLNEEDWEGIDGLNSWYSPN